MCEEKTKPDNERPWWQDEDRMPRDLPASTDALRAALDRLEAVTGGKHETKVP